MNTMETVLSLLTLELSAPRYSHGGNRYGDGIQEKNEASQKVQKVAGGRGWVRV